MWYVWLNWPHWYCMPVLMLCEPVTYEAEAWMLSRTGSCCVWRRPAVFDPPRSSS